jgi:pyruvate/2-oxoglutarate dehydrogenase complex dihydrolipoamide acyltransferase (E2) component
MFGRGGGWGIVMAPPTLMVVVGGIGTRPRFVDGRLAEREMRSVTLSFEHDVVDGAAADLFCARLGTLVEEAHGLSGALADRRDTGEGP